jgi:hypothetical protein
MKSRTSLSFVGLAMLAAMIAGLTVRPSAAQPAVSRTTWEYKAVETSLGMGDQDLNDLGKQGWELVATACPSAHENSIYFYFKRAK